MSRIINATPHAITILSSENVEQDAKKQFLAVPSEVKILKEIPPSGLVPRVAMSSSPAGFIDDIPGNCSPQLRCGIANAATNSDDHTCYEFGKREKFSTGKIEARVKIS